MCTRQVYYCGAKDTPPLTHLNRCTSGREGERKQFAEHDSVQWGCSAQLQFSFFFFLDSCLKQRWVCTTPTDSTDSTLPVWFHSFKSGIWKRFFYEEWIWAITLWPPGPFEMAVTCHCSLITILHTASACSRGSEQLWGGCTPLASLQSSGICVISSVKMCLDTESRDTLVYIS